MSVGPSESRPLSLGRSRSRGRNPSELLARKQQLLNGAQANQQSELGPNWQSSSSEVEPDERVSRDVPHRRSQTRRAKQLERQLANYDRSGPDETRAKSVEAKLESLSQLLKSHQHENGYQQAEGANNKSIDDVYILLAKKEKDLQLAAELGKVLLEKNEELSKANERITEEYSQKLEVSVFVFSVFIGHPSAVIGACHSQTIDKRKGDREERVESCRATRAAARKRPRFSQLMIFIHLLMATPELWCDPLNWLQERRHSPPWFTANCFQSGADHRPASRASSNSQGTLEERKSKLN